MPSKTQYMRGYRTEYLSSDEKSRKIRTVSKMREKFNRIEDSSDISQCIGLIGKEFEFDVPGELTSVKKRVRIILLYPHMALGVYKAGREDEYELKIGFSIADLVMKGLLTFVHGYPEVIKDE